MGDTRWRAGGAHGLMKLMVLTPPFGAANYPSEGCNLDDVDRAFGWLNTAVGGGASLYRTCYQWVHMDEGSATDIAQLMGWMHQDVHNEWNTLIDEPNEVVLGVVDGASNNGGSWDNSRFNMLAEEPTTFGYVNLRDDGIVLHEIAHNLAAQHVGSNPNLCGSNPQSVMNYCWLKNGINTFDTTNDYWVTYHYWH